MALHDARSQRLYVTDRLAAGAACACTEDQAHYLRHVLRTADGSSVLVFNGQDGEWRATLAFRGKRAVDVLVQTQTRTQTVEPDLVYLFAPLKRSRLDYMVQKATELGASRLSPVLTRYTIAERVNSARMRANAVEAAEQCGILRVPAVDEPRPLEKVLTEWSPARRLVFCDEAGTSSGPLAALTAMARGPLAVLIGPEGGFAEDERRLLLSLPFVTPLALGPRIMRADTAAVAALALVNAVLGDWTPQP